MPQFSLWTLMKGMAGVAIFAALATIEEQLAAWIVLLINLLITPHLVMRTYRGTRTERAFCVGLLTPLSGLIILSMGYLHAYVILGGGGKEYLESLQSAMNEMSHYRTHALVTWGVALLSGTACWFVAWREQREEHEDA